MGGMSVTMSADRFEELIADALDSIPEDLMRMLDNVVILVEADSPAGHPRLLGFYYAGVLPDRITIFRKPILSICHTEEQVVTEVRVTVVHEIAHHFGIDDERLHELGWG